MTAAKPGFSHLNLRHPLSQGLALIEPFFRWGGSQDAQKVPYFDGSEITDNRQGAIDDISSLNFVWEGGKFGAALNFNKTGRINYGRTSIQPIKGISGHVVINLNNLSSNQVFVSKRAGSGQREFVFEVQTSGVIRIQLGTSAGNVTVYTTVPTISAGQWFHLSFTWDGVGKGFVVYFDGVSKLTGTHNNTFKDTASDLQISGRTTSVDLFDGAMAFAAVWYRELSYNEIQQMTADPWVMYREEPYRVELKTVAAVTGSRGHASGVGVGRGIYRGT